MGTKKVYYWGGRHPINESIVNHPPEGFEIRSNMNSGQFNIVREYEKGYNLLKEIVTYVYNLLRLPRVIWIRESCDLIHSNSGVIPLNRRPWVVGVEYVSSFVGLQEEKMQNPSYLHKVAKYLSSDYCKKVLPFSEACKKSIENAYKPYLDSFARKLEVLYPAIEALAEVPKPKDEGPVRLLHISGHFFDKGGRELIEAFETLERKYDLELYMIVNAPSHHQDEFKSVLNNYASHQRIHFVTEKLPRRVLFEKYYSTADIFVLPTYIDFFGFVFLEAMTAGLPLVGTDIFAVPEIIKDGVNGFLIHSPISTFGPENLRSPELIQDYRRRIISERLPEVIDQLVEKLSILIEDEDLRKRMGEESRRMVKTGKFSIAEQQGKLKQIYEEALAS